MHELLTCKWCGKIFSPNYHTYDCNRPNCCSKSCATQLKRTKFKTKEELENAITKQILQNDRYTTLHEITNELKISSKLINKYKISILKLNRNCGMRKPQSVYEKIVGDFLYNNFDNVESQKTFQNCLSPKGFLLKFDFYISSKNLLIEADGNQHWDKNNPYYSEYASQCDLIKDNFAKSNNIDLIRIPYKIKIDNKYLIHFLKDYIDSPLTTT